MKPESGNRERTEKSIFWGMVKNDIKSKYATSVFGLIWIFVLPLITIGVFWIVYQVGFRNAPVSDAPFILWFAAGYIPWLFFSDFLSAGANCLVEYSYLVKKIKFNVEILPKVKLAASFVIHLFFVGVLLIMFLIYRIPFSVYAIQCLYYSVALAIYTFGWVLFLSAVCTFFRDIIQIVNIVLQIGFWITPLIWNLREMQESIRNILRWNPISYIVEGYRDSLIYHKWFWEKPIDTAVFWGITLIILVLAGYVFKKIRPFFADEL